MNVICTYDYTYYGEGQQVRAPVLEINVTLLLRTGIATCIVCCSGIVFSKVHSSYNFSKSSLDTTRSHETPVPNMRYIFTNIYLNGKN